MIITIDVKDFLALHTQDSSGGRKRLIELMRGCSYPERTHSVKPGPMCQLSQCE